MIKMTKDDITASLNRKIKSLSNIPEQAHAFFQSHTPVKSGNARSKTVLKNETIVAAYPYAKKLDQGASQQAPDGMSKPTRAFLQKTADAILKRK